MRVAQPEPDRRMVSGGKIMSAEEAHLAWCSQLRSQSAGVGSISTLYQECVTKRLAHLLEKARNTRGKGDNDGQIDQLEVLAVTSGWADSGAVPPNLVPRAAFNAKVPEWQLLIWKLQRIAGPGCLALRPRLWRQALMVALFKRGDALLMESFRLIMVKDQMGLIQESIIAARLTVKVRFSLTPGQSGYERGVDDPQMLLIEVWSEAHGQKRCVWVLLGDFKQAFPRTWRGDLLCILADNAGIHGGMLSLMGEILRKITL